MSFVIPLVAETVAQAVVVSQETPLTTSGVDGYKYSESHIYNPQDDYTIAWNFGNASGSGMFSGKGGPHGAECTTGQNYGVTVAGNFYCLLAHGSCEPALTYLATSTAYNSNARGSLFDISKTVLSDGFGFFGLDAKASPAEACCPHATSGLANQGTFGPLYPFTTGVSSVTSLVVTAYATDMCLNDQTQLAESKYFFFCHPRIIYKNILGPHGTEYATPAVATSMSYSVSRATRQIAYAFTSDTTSYYLPGAAANYTTVITMNQTTTRLELSLYIPGFLEPKSITASSELVDTLLPKFSKYDTTMVGTESSYLYINSSNAQGFGYTDKSYFIYESSNGNNTWNIVSSTPAFFETGVRIMEEPSMSIEQGAITVGGFYGPCIPPGNSGYTRIYFNDGSRFNSFFVMETATYNCGPGIEGEYNYFGTGSQSVYGDATEFSGISRNGTYLGNGLTVHKSRTISHPIVVRHALSTYSGFPNQNVFVSVNGDEYPDKIIRIWPEDGRSMVIDMPRYSEGTFITSCYPSAYNVSYSVTNSITTKTATTILPSITTTSSGISQTYSARWDSSYTSNGKTETQKTTSRSVSASWETHKSISYTRRITGGFPIAKTPYPNLYLESGDAVTFGPCKLTVVSYGAGGQSTSLSTSSTNSFSTKFQKYGGHVYVSDLFFMWAYPDGSFSPSVMSFEPRGIWVEATGSVGDVSTQNFTYSGIAGRKPFPCL